jgi:hypothetical protein
MYLIQKRAQQDRESDSQLGGPSAGVSGISEFYGKAGRTSSGKEDWATGRDAATCDAHLSHETRGRESDHRAFEIITARGAVAHALSQSARILKNGK